MGRQCRVWALFPGHFVLRAAEVGTYIINVTICHDEKDNDKGDTEGEDTE